MLTVKETLEQADREQILGWLAHDLLSDEIVLLEAQNMTIREFQDRYRKYMNDFIETLLQIQPIPSDGMVLFLADSMLDGQRDRVLLACDVHEAAENPDAPYYDIGFTDWAKVLGYHVAENKLTQDHITELLMMLLQDLSIMGTTIEKHTEQMDKMLERLDASLEDIKEGRTIPADEMFRRLSEEFGFPIDEEDPVQEEFRDKVTEAQVAFTVYSRNRERERILKTWKETTSRTAGSQPDRDGEQSDMAKRPSL